MTTVTYTTELIFETIKEIGAEGKNSTVYLAKDKQLDSEIVVKKIEKSKIPDPNEYYDEAKRLYTSSHANVVKVNYGCSDASHIYIAMPFYKNGSLKSLSGSRNLTIREIIRYSLQFLTGLHHIHSKKLIHFDVKPDNILISDTNEALLSDFGLCKAMDTRGLASQSLVYNKQVPPETFDSTEKTLHFDIYLAGLTIYRLLNGDQDFNDQFGVFLPDLAKGNNLPYKDALRAGTFPDRTKYLPHIPIKLQRIVNKAISIDIKDRHANVLELINEISSVNENLDWKYSTSSTTRSWEKANDSHQLKIEEDHSDPKKISIITTKTNLTTLVSSRVTQHCYNNLTMSNVTSKLKQAFKL